MRRIEAMLAAIVVVVEQLARFVLEARIADLAGAAAHQHDRLVPGLLQPAQQHDLRRGCRHGATARSRRSRYSRARPASPRAHRAPPRRSSGGYSRASSSRRSRSDWYSVMMRGAGSNRGRRHVARIASSCGNCSADRPACGPCAVRNAAPGRSAKPVSPDSAIVWPRFTAWPRWTSSGWHGRRRWSSRRRA